MLTTIPFFWRFYFKWLNQSECEIILCVSFFLFFFGWWFWFVFGYGKARLRIDTNIHLRNILFACMVNQNDSNCFGVSGAQNVNWIAFLDEAYNSTDRWTWWNNINNTIVQKIHEYAFIKLLWLNWIEHRFQNGIEKERICNNHHWIVYSSNVDINNFVIELKSMDRFLFKHAHIEMSI